MIISKTPLRVSFFGGGTDLSSFCAHEFGCAISTAIDKYVYLVAHPSFDHKIIVSWRKKREHVENIDEIEHTRVREVMRKTGVVKGIEIHSLAEVASGTGLGSSSAFTVGLLNLLYSYKGVFVTKFNLAAEAVEIETEILKEPIGKQDQYATALGGFNFVKFDPDGSVSVEPIRLTDDNLHKIKARLVAFYLQNDRDASIILEKQNKEVRSNKEKFNTLRKIKEIALKAREYLDSNDISQFGKALHESWLLKRSVDNSISSPEIDRVYERGLKAGATGGKLLGAGGGGFMLFYCEPEKQESLKKELSELEQYRFGLDKEGTRIIYVH